MEEQPAIGEPILTKVHDYAESRKLCAPIMSALMAKVIRWARRKRNPASFTDHRRGDAYDAMTSDRPYRDPMPVASRVYVSPRPLEASSIQTLCSHLRRFWLAVIKRLIGKRPKPSPAERSNRCSPRGRRRLGRRSGRQRERLACASALRALEYLPHVDLDRHFGRCRAPSRSLYSCSRASVGRGLRPRGARGRHSATRLRNVNLSCVSAWVN